MRNVFRVATALVLVLFPLVSFGQVQWGQEYDRQLKSRKTLAAFGPEQFGESVNLYDGTLSFSATDLDVPGNNRLPLSVSRTFSIGNPKHAALDGLFGNWSLSLPYVGVVSDGGAPLGQVPNPNVLWPAGSGQARCSTPSALTPELSGGAGGGTLFALNERTSPKLVRPAMTGMRWVTKDFWYFGCAPTLASGHPGEGFVGVDPSGNKYTFNWMVSHFYPGSSLPGMGPNQIQVHRADVRLYPTKVEDRFGNWVAYQWQGRRLLSMQSSDGRRVDFGYGTDDQITRVTSHGQVWTYSYIDAPSPGVGGRLTAVTNPDGTRWSFGQDPGNYVHFEPRYEMRPITTPGGDRGFREVEILEKVARCSFDHYLSTVARPFEVTHPSGARAVYTVKMMRHGRTGTPAECQRGWDSGGDGGGYVDAAQNSQNMYPAFKTVMSLQSKRVEGPGLAAMTWQYGYSNLQGCVGEECVSQGTPTIKQVTVTSPDGDQTISTFGKNFGENEGQLLGVQTMRGGVVASRTDYRYVTNAQAAQMPFPDYVGELQEEYPDLWSAAAIRPMSEVITNREGVTYVSVTGIFDAFARPRSVAKENTLGYRKTDVTDYYDDLAHWVTGQVSRQYSAETGRVISQTDYNDKALAWRSYSYGKLQLTMAYNVDGTVASVTDGRGNALRLSGWKRGIPQRIQHPATPESPAGAIEEAAVNDSGWMVGRVDENGYETVFDYDPMGRLSRIKYPTGDRAAYHDTTFDLRLLTASDSLPPGVAAGQWRHREVTGNAVKAVYLDAMWRPVLEQQYDAGNAAATLSSTRKSYDSDGQLVFTSYPSAQSGATAKGIRTQYDVLGRVVRQEQDSGSEHGVLSTVTEYLAGLEVRITNPRGLQTTTGFQAWDQPSHDLPVWSRQPEGKVIEVARHAQLGWPLRLTQRSADGSLRQERHYVYDGAAQLCKTIEPETGATVMGYDEAGNLSWSAAGLERATFASTSDCQHQAAWDSGRVTRRTYDSRNRLHQLMFPHGGVGDQEWGYAPDGLPTNVTVWNQANRQEAVVSAYQYNRRRLLVGESVSQPGWYTWGIGYGYNADGNLHTLVYPTGRVIDYAPNALGQPTQVRDANGHAYATGIGYYANGSVKGFTYGNGVTHSMTQNERLLPARVTSSGGVLDFTYAFDQNGNIGSIWDHARDNGNGQFGRWMVYDGLDRLTAAGSCQFGGDCWHRFGYDALDRITSWKLGGVKDYAQYVYDGYNRLGSVRNSAGTAVMVLTYDAQGNLSRKDGQNYGFDYGNRLRQVTGKEYYEYDANGRRVMAWRPPAGTAAATLTLSHYSQAGQVLYQESLGQPNSTHIYLGTSLLATVQGDGAIRYQHTDALGSPVAVTNEAGQVVERHDYEPYGAIIGKPTYSGIGFTGHVMDGVTGLTYMQQRYYDQTLGLFLSVDPVTADPKSGANFNRFKYANNNPYLYVDPDGRQERNLFTDPYVAMWNGYWEGREMRRAQTDDLKKAITESHIYRGTTAAIGLGVIIKVAQKDGRLAVATSLLKPAQEVSDIITEQVAGATIGYKRGLQKAYENIVAVAGEFKAERAKAAEQARAPAVGAATGAASGVTPPGAENASPTAVETAVQAPQGKYRERSK